MAIYSINGTPLSAYGAIASPNKSGTLAISGVFDFPKRDGTTEYDWGSEIEPFLRTQDINFKPKECAISIFIEAKNNIAYQLNLGSLKTALTNLGYLSANYGLFINNLKTTGEIQVDEFVGKYCAKINAVFQMQNGVLSSALPAPSGGSGYTLSNYNLKTNFGIWVQSRKENRSVGKFTDESTTAAYEKSIAQRDLRDIGLNVVMMAISPSAFLTQMSRFHKLLSVNTFLNLKYPDGQIIKVYCKDGFKISTVNVGGGGNLWAKFYLKLREII